MKAATIARIAVLACLLIGADSISFAGEPPSSERSRRRKGDDRSVLGLVVQVHKSLEELNAAPTATPQEAAKVEEKRSTLKQQAIDISAQAPESARVQAAVARAVAAARDLPAAAKYADKAVTLAPQDPFPLVTRGLIRYKQGDYAAAAEDAKEALRSDPADKAAFSLYRLSIGRARGGAEDGSRAVPAGEAAPTEAQVFSESAEPKELDLGEIARLGRDRKKAAGLLEEALGAMRRGDPKRALELSARAAKSDPSLADVYMNRALAHRLIGDLPSAQAEADKAVTLFTIAEGDGRSLAAALALRAELKLGQGDAQGALSDAERALSANPKSAAALLYRARAAEKLGQAAASVLAGYRAAAELEPSFAAEYEEAARRLGGGMASTLPNKAAQDEEGPPWLLLLGAAALILMVAAFAARKWIRSLTRS